MLMVIFSAGASYDSLSRELPRSDRLSIGPSLWRPPLADQLFETRFGPYIQQFRQMHAVVPDLEKPADGVQNVLERFQNEAQTYPRRLNQLAAVRYYLQAMLSNCQTNWENATRGVTNYKALLDRIEHWVRGEKLLVSFNYDTLLEEALDSTVGLKIDDMASYLKSDYQVVKLHGSINWAHRIVGPSIDLSGSETDIASHVIDNAQRLDVNPSIDLVSRYQLARGGAGPIIPALSIPVATKSVYECPELFQVELMDALSQVDKVLMIGWKAGENRFLGSMAQRMRGKVRIMIVSSGEKDPVTVKIKVGRNLGAVGMAADYSFGKKGFSHAITSHEIDEFLKS